MLYSPPSKSVPTVRGKLTTLDPLPVNLLRDEQSSSLITLPISRAYLGTPVISTFHIHSTEVRARLL